MTRCQITDTTDSCCCRYFWHFLAVCLYTRQRVCWWQADVWNCPANAWSPASVVWHPVATMCWKHRVTGKIVHLHLLCTHFSHVLPAAWCIHANEPLTCTGFVDVYWLRLKHLYAVLRKAASLLDLEYTLTNKCANLPTIITTSADEMLVIKGEADVCHMGWMADKLLVRSLQTQPQTMQYTEMTCIECIVGCHLKMLKQSLNFKAPP